MKKIIFTFLIMCLICVSSPFFVPSTSYAYFNVEQNPQDAANEINTKDALEGVNELNDLFVNIISSVGVIFAIIGTAKYAMAFTSDNPHDVSKAITIVVVGVLFANINLLI